MDQAAVLTNIRVLERLGLGTPLLLVMILAMVVVPLPVFALDIFFTFNIVLALTVILVVIYISRPLDFAVFPTVLLLAPCCAWLSTSLPRELYCWKDMPAVTQPAK